MRVQLLAAMAGLALACVGPYRERPDPTGRAAPEAGDAAPESAAAEAAADSATAGAGGALVGHVTPDGRFHPDTGAAAAEPVRVERETVVTGTVQAARAAEDRPAGAPGVDPAPPRTPEAGEAAGYRVQIFAAEDAATAADVARRLEARLEGSPVYVEREGPWHKVRVGDFATRGEAELLRARLAGMGYSGAWIVPTTVRTPR